MGSVVVRRVFVRIEKVNRRDLVLVSTETGRRAVIGDDG